MGPPAAEKTHEQGAEMFVDLFKRSEEPLASFAVKLGDALAQFFDGLDQIGALALQGL